MKTRFPLADGGLQEAASRLFAIRATDLAPDREAGSKQRPVAMSQILAAVLDPQPVRDAPVHAARRQSLVIRRAYDDLLERHSLVVAPVRAAADTGSAGDGEVQELLSDRRYRVSIRTSVARPERCYLVIDLLDQPIAPKILQLTPLDYHEVPHLPLPEPIDGTIQVICRRDDPLIQALLEGKLFRLG